jgi:hypothetical protein
MKLASSCRRTMAGPELPALFIGADPLHLESSVCNEYGATQTARPAFTQLQRRVGWPKISARLGSNAMWICEGMRRLSALTVDRAVTGARFSRLTPATGSGHSEFCRDYGRGFFRQS